MNRSLIAPIREDLGERMVFLSGPRQVGKTTLARDILKAVSPEHPVYLNWDKAQDRRMIRNLSWDRTPPVAVLDEVHKYSRWKTLVKGFHDTEGESQKLLVTGSARLDIFRRGGDSLQGRYFGFRLHPFSIGEANRNGALPDAKLLANPGAWPEASASEAGLVTQLLKHGGFPEPFLRDESRFSSRWRLTRRDRVLAQDLRDLSLVRDIALVEQLVDLLPSRVGSPLSINNLREDLEVDHKTVSRWIELLERLYVVFRVPAWTAKLARTLKKEAKVYFWDWAEVENEGARFENMVACHLLKYCHWMEDVEGVKTELRYIRDREKHEVDFVILRKGKPIVLIEAKLNENTPSKHLAFFRERLNVSHAYQVTGAGAVSRNVFPASRLLAGLP